MKPAQKARRIAQAIGFNVDEFWIGLVTYERFSARNARLWRRAQVNCVQQQVTVLTRPKIRSINQCK